MEILYLLLPVSLLIFAIAIAVFFWAIKHKQFEDLERQGYSIIHDSDDSDNREKSESSPKVDIND